MLFIVVLFDFLWISIVPINGRYRTKFSSSIISPPKQWFQHLSQPHPMRIERFYFYLKQQNNDVLNDHLRIAADPIHHLYQNTPWLTFEQISQMVRPNPLSEQRLNHFLRSHRVNPNQCTRTRDGGILACSLPLAIANGMLAANYSDFMHMTKGVNVTRTLSYMLPEYIADHVITVAPTTIFPHLSLFIEPASSDILELRKKKMHTRKNRKRRETSCECQQYTRPCFLRNRYDINEYRAAPWTNSTLSVIGLMNQYINDSDTRTFLDIIDDNVDSPQPRVTIIGYDNQSMPGREASLDVQYALAMGRGVQTTFWSVPNSNDPFSDFLLQLADMADPPSVISISYGFSETIANFHVFQKAINQELQKAAARGITVIGATGDDGVGGGNYDAQPHYQHAVVSRYLRENNATLPTTKLFHAKGRAIPDVSMRATNYLNIVNGEEKSTSGTSAAAPTFAAFIALLNDYQVRQGRKRLGFLNPLLYQYASMIFYDSTTGHNSGCNTTGFYAASGWDPVTGLGTPSFRRFQHVLDGIANSALPAVKTTTHR